MRPIFRNRIRVSISWHFLLLLAACAPGETRRVAPPPPSGSPVTVDVRTNLERLIEEEDSDGDKRITVEDAVSGQNDRGDGRFRIAATDGHSYAVVGTYYLANLLQELKLAQDAGLERAELRFERIFESPVDRVSRSIRERYWDGLTRRMDRSHLAQIIPDEKMDIQCLPGPPGEGRPPHRVRRHLYVPPTDPVGLDYYRRAARERSDMELEVVELPPKERISAAYVRNLGCRHGILSLALEKTPEGDLRGVPFVVPGGRFNEMFGWDSYFEALGLLVDGRVDLARAMVDNFVYQITHYGMILNANRTYYLTRSQPPFLTSMALAVYEHLPKNEDSRSWLREVFRKAIDEYENVWMGEARLVPETGLNRYYATIRGSTDSGRSDGAGPWLGFPPEVEPGHFDPVFKPYAEKYRLDVKEFEEKYRTGEIRAPELDEFFLNDSCVRESGHDTTYRWTRVTDAAARDTPRPWNWRDDVCHHFVTVDLNSLLYKIESDIARTIEGEFGGRLVMPDGAVHGSAAWNRRAEDRKARMNRYLWNEDEGMFFDHDFEAPRGRRGTGYISATTFYPLWAGLATSRQAGLLVEKALPRLEAEGGVAASAKESRERFVGPARQWDYPHGWPPHQILIWHGLLRYGYDDVAHRLIYRWLYTITRNAADYNGTVPEKFDVVKRSHRVFAEYGNVGTEFAYITTEGFGWMNASYQVGLDLLPSDLRGHLERLVPPEWLFERGPGS